MDSLINTRRTDIQQAYIIYLPGNAISEACSDRCLKSCQEQQQPATLWPGVDGTKGVIQIPEALRQQGWIKWLKVYDHFQSLTEIAVTLSHMTLWAHCMEIDQPIVILEHDAVLIRRLHQHRFYNAVQFLGCREQLPITPGKPIQPLYNSLNQNWVFINRAHAYSIDPAVARRLFVMVLDRGIFESLDAMIHVDAIPVLQDGIYAYDDPAMDSTIRDRKQDTDHGPGMIPI